MAGPRKTRVTSLPSGGEPCEWSVGRAVVVSATVSDRLHHIERNAAVAPLLSQHHACLVREQIVRDLGGMNAVPEQVLIRIRILVLTPGTLHAEPSRESGRTYGQGDSSSGARNSSMCSSGLSRSWDVDQGV
jgi:hypothetical protein